MQSTKAAEHCRLFARKSRLVALSLHHRSDAHINPDHRALLHECLATSKPSLVPGIQQHPLLVQEQAVAAIAGWH